MGQALALGHVGSLSEIRSIVAESVELKTYEPQDAAAWEAAYKRFQEILHLGKKKRRTT
jgi:hypothetical protein